MLSTPRRELPGGIVSYCRKSTPSVTSWPTNFPKLKDEIGKILFHFSKPTCRITGKCRDANARGQARRYTELCPLSMQPGAVFFQTIKLGMTECAPTVFPT
jgi:hypothetical protein